MSLRIVLKPNERIIIDGAVIRNGTTTAHLFVENKVPVLRQKDILTEAEANTPCKRIYLVVQLMYIGDGLTDELSGLYWQLARDIIEAAPSMKHLISDISQSIVDANFYQALKQARILISSEEELMRHATECG
jgi:flagellar protein FlbT